MSRRQKRVHALAAAHTTEELDALQRSAEQEIAELRWFVAACRSARRKQVSTAARAGESLALDVQVD